MYDEVRKMSDEQLKDWIDGFIILKDQVKSLSKGVIGNSDDIILIYDNKTFSRLSKILNCEIKIVDRNDTDPCCRYEGNFWYKSYTLVAFAYEKEEFIERV